MPVLNYRYRLMPTPSQASVLGASMEVMGWGWNLMVRRTARALRLIRRGHAGTVQRRLAERVAGKSFTGMRAAKVNKLVAAGMTREAAERAVRGEMSGKVFGMKRSRLAMEAALLEADAAKQGQMGSALGSAWAQLGVKWRNTWEKCWKSGGQHGAPRRKRVQDAGWLQSQIANVPGEAMFRHAEPFGPYGENWVDLGRFFPMRLTKLPARIKEGTAKSLQGLKGDARRAEIDRLKAEFASLAEVRLLQHRPMPEGAVVKDIKVTRSSHRDDAVWFVLMAVEVPEHIHTKVYPVTGRACGINPARRHALTVVGEDHLIQGGVPGEVGFEAGPGRPLARAQRKLRRLQRRLDRQRRANNPACFDEKGRWIKGKRLAVFSKRMIQTEAEIRAIHARVANQRKEAYHRVAEDLLKRYDTIYLGDWKTESPAQRRAMKKARKVAFKREGKQRAKGEASLEKIGAKMDQENALGVFRQILAEKVARSAGFKALVAVPEPFTTQACAKCQQLTGPKGFGKQGWWTCAACGHRQIRHRTAAYNILQDGPKAAMEQTSEPAPEGAGEAPQKSPARGKGAMQALKGGGDTTVGRTPDEGEGASAPGPARENRKAPTPAALRAAGPPAPARAKSTGTRKRRAPGPGESQVADAGSAEGPTAGAVLADIRGNRTP